MKLSDTSNLRALRDLFHAWRAVGDKLSGYPTVAAAFQCGDTSITLHADVAADIAATRLREIQAQIEALGVEIDE